VEPFFVRLEPFLKLFVHVRFRFGRADNPAVKVLSVPLPRQAPLASRPGGVRVLLCGGRALRWPGWHAQAHGAATADDHERARAAVQAGEVSALAGAGYAVDEADNGRDAQYLGEVEDFDAVVLDLGLPVLDGLSVLQALARGPGAPCRC
jgi:hypothetical protein